MSDRKWCRNVRAVALSAAALLMLGFAASNATAGGNDMEPIVGLWQITVKDPGGNFLDSVFSVWTNDGTESDQDLGPILLGYVCYGTWIKLGERQYGLTHPYFEFDQTTGHSIGTSAYFNYTVTVSRDGKTFSGKQNGAVGVPGLNPYTGGGTLYSGLTISATKVQVDKSLLP